MAKKPVKEEPNVSPGESRDSADDRGIINTIWNFLSSMKLGIILLLILAAASIIGTVWVPRDMYGQPDYLRFYNNPVFNLILALLALNILICSLNRWKSLRGTLKGPKADVSENFVKNLKSHSSIKVKTGPDKAFEKIRELLRKKGYRVFTSEEGETFKVASDRGHLGIIGPYLTHLSFLVIILAVMIKFSGLAGFDGTFVGWEGETYSLGQVQGIDNVDFDDYFDIRVEDFRTEYRPGGREIKQWYSDLKVIDGDNSYDFTLYVNKPLVHNGIKFYQSSFGHQFSGKVSGPEKKDQDFSIAMQDYVQPEGTDLFFVPMGYDDANKEVKFYLYQGRQAVFDGGVALNTPYKYGDAEVTFQDVRSYTVLSTKKDPGVPVIGAGSILLIVGIVISFLLRQRRIWSVIRPEKEGSLIEIGGISAKDKRGLDRDLEYIASELKNR